jgi:hypothetical protein
MLVVMARKETAMKRLTKWLAASAGIALASYGSYAAVTWSRYGHPRRARGDEEDALLDRFMREHDVVERHHVAVAAPAAVTFRAAQALSLDRSRIIRAIVAARALLLRAPDRPLPPSRGFVEDMKALGWGLLAEVPGREIVMGGVTRPWEPDPVFVALEPDAFAAYAEHDHVKIVFTLRVDAAPDGGSVFRTETRAVATDAGARKKFRRYWALLSPGILIIRRAMLAPLAAAADRTWRLEGDDLLADVHASLTHATMIDAPPADVWPWLLQMGGQRAGWYSWDRLDNGGQPSADHIIPALQHLDVGDVLPARPTGKEGFKVLRIVPERALVLGSLTPRWEGTWAFVLEPVDDGRTRLVTRYRAAYPPSRSMSMAMPAIAALHSFMEKKQLRTIKHHAEHVHAT